MKKPNQNIGRGISSGKAHRVEPKHPAAETKAEAKAAPDTTETKSTLSLEKHPETITGDQVGNLADALSQGGAILVTETGTTPLTEEQVAAIVEDDQGGINSEAGGDAAIPSGEDSPEVTNGMHEGDSGTDGQTAGAAEETQENTATDGSADDKPDESTDTGPKLQAPEARDPTKHQIAHKRGAQNEATRDKPDTSNFRMLDRAVKAGHAVKNSGDMFRALPGNGSRPTSVWGQVAAVAGELSKANEGGIFSAQALFNALYVHDFVKGGARPKYDPVDEVAYTGWIHSLVAGAPSKNFRCVERVAANQMPAKAA